MWIINYLNIPAIIPLIPRVQDYYTQTLGINIFHNDLSSLTLIEDQKKKRRERLSQEEISKFKNHVMLRPAKSSG